MSGVSLKRNTNQKFQRILVNPARTLSHPKTTWIREQSTGRTERTIWSITFMSLRSRPWSLKRPVPRNCELNRFVRTPQNVFPHVPIQTCKSSLECLFHIAQNSRSIFCSHSIFTWISTVFGLHGTDCSTLHDMTNFEESAANGKMSSLSKSNHKLTTEITGMEWNVYFPSASEIFHFHSNAYNKR